MTNNNDTEAMGRTLQGQDAAKIREAMSLIPSTSTTDRARALVLLTDVAETLEFEAFFEAVVKPGAKAIAEGIIADARNTEGPIVWVTGNSYMPPARSFTEFEYVHQHPMNENTEAHPYRAGEATEGMWEEVEKLLSAAKVETFVPEFDNSIYAVDLARWEYIDTEAGEEPNPDFNSDDLNSEWRRIENTEDGPGRYEVTIRSGELISFTLDATGREDAEDRYLMDGDETGSDTTDTEVVSITKLSIENTEA